MPNETYLIVSYFSLAALSLSLALVAYGLLRRSFAHVANTLSGERLAGLLRASFPIGMVLLALSSCLAVSYTFTGCGSLSYEKVVQNREWIVARNVEQATRSLQGVVLAIVAWDVVTLLVLTLPQPKRPGTQPTNAQDDRPDET